MNIETKKYIISTWEEWSQFYRLRNFNWSAFHLFDFEFEYDRYCGQLEFTMVIAGFGIRVAINITTDISEETHKHLHEITHPKYLWVHKSDLDKIIKKETYRIAVFRTRKDAREYRKILGNKGIGKVFYYEKGKI